MISARPASYVALVVHSMMSISEILIESPKIWNYEILDNYINPEDVPLIQSKVINQGHQQNEYCWSYMKSGMHTVKSGYWIATNLLNRETIQTHLEPSMLGG